jgi:protein-tyrosine phosphatase
MIEPGTSGGRTGVLFVCLGNICRSPLAKGIFTHLVRQNNSEHLFEIDSCGTGGWHAGGPADSRTIQVARNHGVEFPHVARKLDPDEDFSRFHYLLAMDLDNKAGLLHAGAPPAKVFLLRSFDPALAGEPEQRLEVPDPYYGGPEGFENMFVMLHAACEGLLRRLARSPTDHGGS